MLPKLNWNDLRTWDGSQHTAFEKLCCQLFSDDQPCPGAKFIVKGDGPDAGVECFWQLPNSDEHGLQAKFFLDSPSNNQWSQIDHSVETALEKHPQLTQYVVCLPTDRSDARQSGRKSMLDRWNERVIKWQEWANSKGMTVDFSYWGEHEIVKRLNNGNDSRGRWFFWFHQEFFDQEWFQTRFEQAVDTVGPRYTPPLNVELPVAKTFDGLGRTNAYFEDIFALYRQLKELLGHYENKRIEALGPEQYHQLERQLQNLLDFWGTIPNCQVDEPVNFDELKKQIGEARSTAAALNKLAHHRMSQSDDHDNSSENVSKEDAEVAFYALSSIDTALVSCLELTEGKPSNLVNTPAMLLVGDAGTGKTHLFCDVAKKRLAANRPTILIVGEWFDVGEPWSQIIQHLHLPAHLTMEDFLGALNTAAQIQNSRALILIDALNESRDPRLWQTHLAMMLSNLKQYKHLGIAVSVRTPHDEAIVPLSVKDLIIRVQHDGFAGFEYQAVKTFFDYYHIEQPSVPLLNPEFRNPLFLKLICEGLKAKGLTRLPPGLTGITRILDFFLEAANAEVANKLDYNPHSNMVKRAIDDLIVAMIEAGDVQISQEDAVSIVNRHLSSQEYKRSLYYHMLSVGVLTQHIVPISGELVTRFSYERFADHLITKHLCEQHIDAANPTNAFAVDQNLGQILNGEKGYRLRYSLITGLAVQLPETIGKELVEVAPYLSDDWYVKKAFLDSLIWRQWASSDQIPDGTLAYINQEILPYKGTNDDFLGVLVSVATNPDNPFNADFTHQYLMRFEMAERDAWWSIFLHEHYNMSEEYHSPINRLIEWAWAIQNSSHLDRVALRLTGTMLTWFLTSSNRYLRDRATKALINLFGQEIPSLIEVITSLLDVNDPYVLERLFAVAYGCAMRSNDIEAISTLAQNVYVWIFEDGAPPPHILLRDYTSGVIEVALAKQAPLSIQIDKIRPPYQGDWITDPPSQESLEEKYRIPTGKIDYSNRAQVSLMSSISDWGDFGRYVVDRNIRPWKSIRLDEPNIVSPQRKHHQFFESLTPEQQELWKKHEEATHRINQVIVNKTDWDEWIELYTVVDPLDILGSVQSDTALETDDDETSRDTDDDSKPQNNEPDEIADFDIEKELARVSEIVEQRLAQLTDDERATIQTAESDEKEYFTGFLESLTPEQCHQFENEIFPYMQNSVDIRNEYERNARFSTSLAERWILQKVFDLGWTLDRFGEFDGFINRRERRESKKPERIGKKYQWLAYHEFLARVSDNFRFRGDHWSDNSDEDYQGAWQLNVRDFDPSILVAKTHGDSNTQNWWFPTRYTYWSEDKDIQNWLQDDAELPVVEDLIQVTNPSDNSSWFVMQSFCEWVQPLPPTEKLYESPTRRLWYMLKSYVVKSEIFCKSGGVASD